MCPPKSSVLSCPPGREVWIADSGASVHITCDPCGMFDCVPAEPGTIMIVGRMACMHTECLDKLRIKFHSTEDVDTILHDVAYIPDVGMNLFSVHTAMRGGVVMGDRTGMYVMRGRLFFPWYESSYALTATRSPPVPPVVAAVIAPGAEPPYTTQHINDFHVSYTHGHTLSLVETTRQLGITLTGELFPCSGCSMAKRKRLPILKTTSSCFTRPLK